MGASEPMWLTAEEQETWIAFIRVVTRVPAVLDTQLQRDADLSHFEYYVLAALSGAPSRTLRMSVLAASAGVSLSHLSRVATRLEARGFLERRAHPDDRRSTLASLTKLGHKTLVAAAPGHVEAVRSTIFDVLTPQQAKQLGKLCAILHDNLFPESAEAVGELL